MSSSESPGHLKYDKLQSPVSPSGDLSDHAVLKNLIDSNIVAVGIADIYGNIKEMNKAYENIFGYTAADFAEGRARWDLMTPAEYRSLDESAIEQLRTTGVVAPFEKETYHKDGHRVPILIGLSALNHAGTEVISVIIDLSHHKYIQRELENTAAQFRDLAESVPTIVWTTLADGKAEYCNKQFYDYCGLNRDDDDGFMWRQTIHAEDLERCLPDFQRAISEKDTCAVDIRYKGADGVYRWFAVRAMPLFDAEGKHSKWFGTATDIDAKRQREDELKESEARFRTLAEAIPQIVWTTDAQGQITFFNQRWFEYTGLTLEQSQDSGWLLLIHDDEVDGYLANWAKALDSGDSFEFPFRLKRAVGFGKTGAIQYRWHLARAVALRGKSGQIMEWFGTWTDIHEQKRSRP